jgi:hypothetical protein
LLPGRQEEAAELVDAYMARAGGEMRLAQVG